MNATPGLQDEVLAAERAPSPQQFLAGSDGSDQTYAVDRRARRRRLRHVGFLVCVPLWLVSAVPLGREILEGGAAGFGVYLAVAAASFGVAAVLHGGYALLRKRKLLSPWVFVLAAAMALAGYAIQSAGEPDPLATATGEIQAGPTA